MDAGKLDDFICRALRRSGWRPGRSIDIEPWVRALSAEGFKINAYARSVLESFGGLAIRSRGDGSHCAVAASFDPLTASGEHDRMPRFEQLCGESLFPLGEFFDFFLFAGESQGIYAGDWKRLMLVGITIEVFFRKAFEPGAEPEREWSLDESQSLNLM